MKVSWTELAVPGLLLLWAPRHPERFPRVEALAREQGWKVATRRQQQWPAGQAARLWRAEHRQAHKARPQRPRRQALGHGGILGFCR